MLLDNLNHLDRRVDAITEPKQGRRHPGSGQEIELVEAVVVIFVPRPLPVSLEACLLTCLAGLFLTLLLALSGNKLPSVESSSLQVRIVTMADIGPDLSSDDGTDDEIALIERILGQVAIASALVVLAAQVAPNTIGHSPCCLLVATKELRNGFARRRIGVAFGCVITTSSSTAKVGLQGEKIRAVFLGSGDQIIQAINDPVEIQTLTICVVGRRRRLVSRGSIAERVLDASAATAAAIVRRSRELLLLGPRRAILG